MREFNESTRLKCASKSNCLSQIAVRKRRVTSNCVCAHVKQICPIFEETPFYSRYCIKRNCHYFVGIRNRRTFSCQSDDDMFSPVVSSENVKETLTVETRKRQRGGSGGHWVQRVPRCRATLLVLYSPNEAWVCHCCCCYPQFIRVLRSWRKQCPVVTRLMACVWVTCAWRARDVEDVIRCVRLNAERWGAQTVTAVYWTSIL